MDMKQTVICLAMALIASLFCPTHLHAERIAPIHLLNGSGGENTVVSYSRSNSPAPYFTVYDYGHEILRIQNQGSHIPPTVLGAVRLTIDPAAKEIFSAKIDIPLIAIVPAGTALEVVQPNATGSGWAITGKTAIVEEDSKAAIFTAKKSGVYALYNPEWDRYMAESQESSATVLSSQKTRAESDFGLFLQNSAAEDKIPLVLVHGDNSYKQDQARWGDFLDWVEDNASFDEAHEIWVFVHDTTKLIGFDGNTGNAKALGDAIVTQFSVDRPILLLAHSRGGLVSRSYMRGYGDGSQGGRVLGLVTLATPHHGSPAAVPEWGLETVKGEFRDVELAKILYDDSPNAVVDVSDMGTMGLAWDNFDGPEHGIDYRSFTLESNLGNNHLLSVMDANRPDPQLEEGQSDPTVYLPDRVTGTLEEMNRDLRYAGKIIAYGGYDTELGLEEDLFLNLTNVSLGDHAGLMLATQIIANMRSKNVTNKTEYHYMANDGMVPLQSALFLKKDSAAEPITEVKEDTDLGFIDTYEIALKDFRSRLQFRKVCTLP
jgi:triacylglycerol esterase/lipase EstA (alpha/beta hydrolase family)